MALLQKGQVEVLEGQEQDRYQRPSPEEEKGGEELCDGAEI